MLADAEHFDTPLTLTFAQLARDVHRAAAVLPELGIRRGDAAIGSYLGSSDVFDRATAAFAEAYADQTERDHAALLDAMAAGRIQAQPDR